MQRNNDVLHLYNFRPHEFGPTPFRKEDWWHFMCPRLLVLLDVFRTQWNQRVRISNNEFALGRRLGPDNESQHNVDKYGECRAADCFPEGIHTREDAEYAVALAREIGFTGIGLYPDWNGGVGLHLDTRRDRQPGDPATWGALNDENGEQDYVTLEFALSLMSDKRTDTSPQSKQRGPKP